MIKTITIEEAKSLLQDYQKRPLEDQRALCCLLGAYAGDNLGNYNEFKSKISDNELEDAMTMPGKGSHNLVPGQSTDDTELSTSMAYGIIGNSDPKIFDCNLISKFYTIWLKSSPFDLGVTIGSALRINQQLDINIESTAEQCKQRFIAQRNRLQTLDTNQNSQSNGGCMRISTLCVYLSKQTDQKLIRRIVLAEQSLTHCSEPALEAAYVYVRLVINLIRGATAKQAYLDLQKYFKNECQVELVKEWWNEKQKSCQFDSAIKLMGWIKHALTQCFVVLKRLSDEEDSSKKLNKEIIYQKHIKTVLKLCGDSDSNCAIVGGMLGAYLSLKEFPSDYLQKIVNCNLQDKSNSLLRHPRDPIYNPRNCIYLCSELLKKSNFDGSIQIIDEILTEDLLDQIVSADENHKTANQLYWEQQLIQKFGYVPKKENQEQGKQQTEEDNIDNDQLSDQEEQENIDAQEEVIIKKTYFEENQYFNKLINKNNKS